MKPLKEQIEELRGHGYSAVLAFGQKGVKWGMSMGLVKTRRLAAMHPPPPAASTSAKATVDEPKDKEAAARDPPSPRLRRIKGGHAAALQGP